jgi:hypothetical protein
MLSLRMPDRPPEQDVSWKIVVGTTLRQGGTIVHSFRLRVGPPVIRYTPPSRNSPAVGGR